MGQTHPNLVFERKDYLLTNAVSHQLKTVNIFDGKNYSIGSKILAIITWTEYTNENKINVSNCSYVEKQQAIGHIDGTPKSYGCTFIVTITGNNPVFNYSFGSVNKGTESRKSIQVLLCNLGNANIN